RSPAPRPDPSSSPTRRSSDLPLVGEPVSFSGFFRGPASGHILGLVGGCIWGTGTVFNMVAASFTGVAISYAIGQSAPMVAALWGDRKSTRLNPSHVSISYAVC